MNPRPRATMRTFGIVLLMWGAMLCAVPFVFGPPAPALDALQRTPGRVASVTPVAPTRATEADLDVELLTDHGLVTVRAGFCRSALAGIEPGQPLTLWTHPYAGIGDVKLRAWQAEAGSETLCPYESAAAAAARGDWLTVLSGVAMLVLGAAGLAVSRVDPTQPARRRRPAPPRPGSTP